MLNIKRFIEKVSSTDTKQGQTLTLPMAEARMLRDEIAKLIADNYELLNNKQKGTDDEVIKIEINGGSFR